MKHRIRMRKLSRDKDHRRALFRNQATSLIEHERIETTVAKAKEMRRIADRLITMVKRGTPRLMEKANFLIQDERAREKLQGELAERFRERNGGYTRVLKTRFRRGDCAQMAVIEWSETPRTILTAGQLERRELRKSKYRRHPQEQMPHRVGLAQALD